MCNLMYVQCNICEMQKRKKNFKKYIRGQYKQCITPLNLKYMQCNICEMRKRKKILKM